MKIRNSAFVFLAILLGTGCSALDFNVNQESDEVILKGNLDAFRANVLVPSDLIPAQDLAVAISADPAGIYAKDATLELTDGVPSAFNMQIPFSFIYGLEIWLVPASPASELEALKLAWTGAPSAGTTVDLTVDRSTNLLPYLREEMLIKNVLNARVPAADLSFKTRFVLGIDVF